MVYLEFRIVFLLKTLWMGFIMGMNHVGGLGTWSMGLGTWSSMDHVAMASRGACWSLVPKSALGH
jgi:hypothetical protein